MRQGSPLISLHNPFELLPVFALLTNKEGGKLRLVAELQALSDVLAEVAGSISHFTMPLLPVFFSFIVSILHFSCGAGWGVS